MLLLMRVFYLELLSYELKLAKATSKSMAVFAIQLAFITAIFNTVDITLIALKELVSKLILKF